MARNGFFQPYSEYLPLPVGLKRNPKIVLCHSPIEWHALACPFLKGGIVSRNRFF